MSHTDNIQQAAQLIRNSQRIAILTGAGVSKESGVPTFRDAQSGLWAKYDPQELATPQAFQNNPRLVWDWYQFRRELVKGAEANPGHIALVEIQRRYPATTIITQNVDTLHERAGSHEVIHLHGNIMQNKCVNHCQGEPTLIDLNTLAWDHNDGPPLCPYCGAFVRPDVVWFGEALPQDGLEQAMTACAKCDLMIVIGTSGLVHPAAALPGYSKVHGTPATIIEVNPDITALSGIADLRLVGPSGEMLPKVIKALDNDT